ncbi:hypothetical protein GCM10010306_025550 [Streptomyces umbrinus]|nr:hypothetical protein GCM10010306_025550 [Streptomyces umbrinus]
MVCEGLIDSEDTRPHRPAVDDESLGVVRESAGDHGTTMGSQSGGVLEAELAPVAAINPQEQHAGIEPGVEVDGDVRAELEVAVRDAERARR